jgi:ABC-type branched-subunit amino acid transport system ATPase component
LRTKLAEAAARAERSEKIAANISASVDANHRSQLEELGLYERFPNLSHIAADMGEALVGAERERDALRRRVATL